MTPSLILRTWAPLLLWGPLIASLYILLRGHNEPGGGFIGGLVASTGLLFYAIAHGRMATERRIRLHPVAIAGIGILLAAVSGLPALLDPAVPYLTHLWWFPDFGIKLPIGTALLFDLGVYITVVGMSCAIFFALMAWQEEIDTSARPEEERP
jgi:multicomponent Na+:H+ antiporter subunit B